MDYKVLLGIISIIVALTGYLFYFQDIFKAKTKPHAFSWLVWGILSIISFAAQVTKDAGPGAWVNGATTLICFILFLLALQKGEKRITNIDWISLVCALLSLFVWYLTKEPLFAVILICIIDFCGFCPTIRKSYNKPHEETVFLFFMSGLSHVFAILALANYLVVNWLYSAVLVFLNWTFVLLLLWRRKVLA